MRAFLIIFLVALLSTACSTANEADGTASTHAVESGVADDETANAPGESAARTLGEPDGAGEGPYAGTAGESSDEAADDTEGAFAFKEDVAEPSEDVGSSEDPDVSEAPSDPATESTELSRVVDQLIAFVEQERGHDFVTRPAVTLLDGEEFTAAWNELVADDAAENATEYANFTDIYRAMDIIDGSLSLEQIWMRFGDAGVLGYYDPDSGQIVLRSGEITAFTKTVLVHELVHALDDQIFGIRRVEHDSRSDEIDWTFSSLIEGSAGVIEGRYRATLSQAERDEEVAVQRAIPSTVSLSDFETSFLELQFGRYRYGDAFASALWEEGRDAVDDAFVEPPSTSEVIIDPQAYFTGAGADAVEQPPADGDVFESGVWGQAAWAALFADVFGRSEALDLADGWGGDQFVAWRTNSETCVRAHISGDTPDALDNYAFALEEWASESSNREVFYPTADLVRVTACG